MMMKEKICSSIICQFLTMAAGYSISNCNQSRAARFCHLDPNIRVNWEKAHNACSRYSPAFHLPSGTTNRDQLLQAMVDLGMWSVWLSMRRHFLTNWTWTDGTTGIEPESGTLKGLCGIYDVQKDNGYIAKSPCNFEIPMRFICQSSGLMCRGDVPRHDCYVDNGTVWTLRYGAYSWYNARSICRATGGDLISEKSSERLGLLVEKLHGNKKPKTPQGFLIGIRKSDWFHVDHNFTLHEAIQSYWTREVDIDSLTSHDNSCAVLSGRSRTWVSEKCTNRSHFLCEYASELTSSAPPSTVKSSDIDATELAWFYRWTILGLLAVITVMCIVTVIIVSKYRTKQTTDTSEEPDILDSDTSSNLHLKYSEENIFGLYSEIEVQPNRAQLIRDPALYNRSISEPCGTYSSQIPDLVIPNHGCSSSDNQTSTGHITHLVMEKSGNGNPTVRMTRYHANAFPGDKSTRPACIPDDYNDLVDSSISSTCESDVFS